ncbi:heat-like protein [Grosmannia clavigera kw1407]|uniref:eIF-2-alpha kinase activator GCN1 n=1 Tax=Grosmannia clavigera (strain kw1407 / UAMH 11150) TaxID=655863 RepID=F0XDN4_GROCL|nr:heat-like protein [Grosmannia clavigera kw1407]EFX04322.1 heat-like protein [Grosmannia clavigera kw1407]
MSLSNDCYKLQRFYSALSSFWQEFPAIANTLLTAFQVGQAPPPSLWWWDLSPSCLVPDFTRTVRWTKTDVYFAISESGKKILARSRRPARRPRPASRGAGHFHPGGTSGQTDLLELVAAGSHASSAATVQLNMTDSTTTVTNGAVAVGLDPLSTRVALLTSSKTSRIAQLRTIDDKIVHGNIDPTGIAKLLPILFWTHGSYEDRASRRAVQRCLASICDKKDAALLTPLVAAIRADALKTNTAVGGTFVLTEWCSLLMQHLAGTSLWDSFSKDILQSQAGALEKCTRSSVRPSVAHSALVIARRGFRKLIALDGTREQNIKEAVQLLAAKGPHPTALKAVFLGVIAGVSSRNAKAKPIFAGLKSQYFEFYTREITGSKVPLASNVADGLHDFFAAFVAAEDLQTVVVPALKKGLLRAPEILLDDLITPLVKALPQSYDLSKILDEQLSKPLLSNVKSSKESVRNGSLTAFRAISTRCTNLIAVGHVVDEALVPLQTGKLSSPEHRALHSQILEVLPKSDATTAKVAVGIATAASKEGNEAALVAETSSLTQSTITLLKGTADLAKTVIDAYVKGMSDKKPPVRRIWIMAAGEALYTFHTWQDSLPANASKFAEAVLPPLLEIYTEVLTNPATASQSGLVIGGFVTCGIASLLESPSTPALTALSKKFSVKKQCLTLGPKPSFLLSPRIYTKLTSDGDIQWLYRALLAVFVALEENKESATNVAWAEAYIYAATSTNGGPLLRKEATSALTDLYFRHQARVSEIAIAGAWHWLEALDANDKESAPVLSKAQNEQLLPFISAICRKSKDFVRVVGKEPEKSQLELQMCSLVVLARSVLIPSCSWIELCLRVEVDPGSLAEHHEELLLQEIAARTVLTQKSEPIKSAAYEAAAELVFVAPDKMAPRIVELIRQDLDAKDLHSIGPVEAAIFRAPEGTTFIDVLAKKQSSLPSKNSKDYDVLKWEEELRTQLAQKKGQQKKLTAEETAKVNAQLKKEAEIRRQVSLLEARLLRGLGVIRSLAQGPPTDATLWMGPSVRALMAAIEAGACLITGDVAPLAFIALAERVSSRLGSLRTFIGVATLRAHGITSLPDVLQEEPLPDLVTRVLYRLRGAGEQRPFDAVSLIYMVPLLLLILQNGGFSEAADERDTQLVLSVEILSFHTDVCSDEAVPRAELLAILTSAMQKYSQHYKIIKDCFSDLVRCVAPNISEEEVGVLVQGAIVPQGTVRSTVLQSVNAEVDMSDLPPSEEIWLACHDDIEENVDLGREIWEESGFKVTEELPVKTLPYLESKDSQLRRAAARSLAEAISVLHSPRTFDSIAEKLRASYIESAKPRVAQLDEFGMPRKMDLSDPWEARHGIATAFKELAPNLDNEQVEPFLHFLIEQGPLGDQNGTVRGEMLDAAIKAIEVHGKPILAKLMQTFETTLAAPDKNSEAADRVNEAVIIMYGALARHLKPGDAKIPVVIERLLATLSTPSETVQYAIAECLPPLVRTCGDKSSKYFNQITETLMTAKNYAVQRGAAYGLAGLTQGRGIAVLKEYRILTTLRTAMENKKEANQRESALLAYELLSTILGRLFEPYVIQIVPQLLVGFGDGNLNVRDASLAAAKACFARLSSFGVKKILPTLLDGLDDPQWRSKKGACDLLGAMAYLDPQQLAESLPDIIPPLTAVLNDSHKEVRAAANKSLKRFGEVISNPEVRSLVDILLKALSDATKYTDDALDALIKVQFVHYLDAPSLALISRILQRGLGDRSNTKRKAAQVIGSLAHLTEKKDLVAHLPVLVAGLKIAVVDPVPTTRATASRALGSLVEKLGEDALPDLIPGLMQTLKSDTGAGDRLGSAQALSEVLAGLGTTRLEETLPTILQNVESSKPSVREGFMSLFIFLPVCFGNSFSAYLGKIIPPILAGLADDVDSIRETALRAGRLLVRNFASRAVDLLLPELERGLADNSWRIRLSSVELVGDLLFNLSGITAKQDGDEDEEVEEEAAREAGSTLREVLGVEKRDKILSALYVCRCDTAVAVRTAAMGVWKALVPSPRILKELVPTLTQLIIRRLGSANMEHKVIASNALGELIRRAGDNILLTLLPTLAEGLRTSSADSDAKQGICIALKELISSANEDALEEHEAMLLAIVQSALTDADDEVREAAAEAFDSLQQIMGKRAVDQVLPSLLRLLQDDGETAQNALSALLTLLTDSTRSNMILPNLIPTLIRPPISAFNAKALASLSTVAGAAMNRRLPHILNSLMDNVIETTDEQLRADLETSFDTVVQSMDEHDGLNTVMNVLLQLLRHEDHHKREAVARRLAVFFAKAHVDYSRYNQDLIRALLISFDDRDQDVVRSAWGALSELTKRLKKEEMEALVGSTRQTLQQVGVAGVNLAGFELPKGINAVLPIFLQGLMNGTAEQRTTAALAIADVVDRTSEASLRPFVTQMTGPLIRVVTERSTEVKCAILLTLNNLLAKMPAALKPFLPQLQRTFTKSLADPTSELLRSRAARALGTLIRFTPRVDPLIAELVAGSRTADPGVRNAMLTALFEVISKAGASMGEPSRTAILALIDSEPDGHDDNMAITNAKLLGALVKNVPAEAATNLLRNRVVPPSPTGASALALNAVLLESPEHLLDSAAAEDLPGVLCQGMTNKNLFIADNFILATGKYLLGDRPKSYEDTKDIFETLATIIPPGGPANSRRLALVLVRTLTRVHPDAVRPHLALLAPPIFASVRDMVIPVKLSAEAAFMGLFDVLNEEAKVFDKYMSGPAAAELPPNTKRVMGDYFKRVTLRLAAQGRERRDAEGGAGGLGLFDDEVEDEREIWSVGKVDIVADVFGKE